MFRKSLWIMTPLVIAFIVFLTVRQNNNSEAQEGKTIKAQVIAKFPHDQNDFCQGLVVEGSTVLEGTGRYGSSVLKEYDLTTGKPNLQAALDSSYFGEGITVLRDKVYQLTWKERMCVVYERKNLKYIGQMNYAGEGWGLTNDGKHLYMSNGTSMIQVLDPNTFKQVRKFRVTYGRKQEDKLNELEFVGDELWACIWYEDRIARIDPQTGKIKGYLDCSSLFPKNQRPDKEYVLNGIAFDAEAKRLFITGKLWSNIFEIAVPDDVTGLKK
ncbi:MAG: glutaminyl-peptide cyclotransferase [Pirellulales bacterium]